jgi:hypothetical protein
MTGLVAGSGTCQGSLTSRREGVVVRDDLLLRSGEDVVRAVLVALAPGELPGLGTVLESYRIKPWTLAGDYGAPVAQVDAWAPFVLGFVAETVVGLIPEPATRRAGRRWWSGLFVPWGRPRHDDPAGWVVPAFEDQQLRQVWAAASDAATARGYSTGDREAFAAAVVAALASG